MKIKGIKYVGPIFDGSGYAQACRGNILILRSLGIPITLSPVTFEGVRPDLGEEGKILESLKYKKIDYNIVYMHMTPEFYSKYREEDKVNIGHIYWETTKIHPDWFSYINDNLSLLLVGCTWNKEVCEDCGIIIPIGVIPYGINVDEFDGIEPYKITGVSNEDYIFYSIFQFTERKHPIALIKAYWYAFQNNENVALVLKTYRNDYAEAQKDIIRETVKRLKEQTPMDNYPKVYLVLDMLTQDEMLGLHSGCNCYVSLDRGEGFGLPHFSAGASGNPIIVTGFGGITEYAKEHNSYLIDYLLTPVSGMPWSGSPTTLIGCKNKIKQIKDVKVGDLVFNKNGNLKKVLKVGDRPLLDDECMHSIKHVSAYSSIEITNKHELYIVRNGTIILEKAKNITTDDYLLVPKYRLYKNDFSVNMVDYKIDEKWVEINDRIIYVREKNNSIGIYKNIKLSEELFYLIGLYLAEGCVYTSSDCVSFTFNLNEKNTLAAKCINCLKVVFGLEDKAIHTRELTKRNGFEIIVGSVLVGRFFKSEFGTGSHFKHIPYRWKLNYNKIYREMLLKGYWDGDGHISYRHRNQNSPEYTSSTASKSLVMDLRDLLFSLDIVPSITKNIRKDGRVSHIISITSSVFDSIYEIDCKRNKRNENNYKLDENHFAVRVKSNQIIEDYCDVIYSMSVETDCDEEIGNGSYILNGVASSNSPWYRGDQLWAEPDVLHGANLMKEVYNNQAAAKQKGLILQKEIKENFSWEAIGKRIVKELEKI